MNNFLSVTGVLIGAAMTVAVGSDIPVPGPQNVEVNLRADDAAQEPSPRVEQDRTHDESNETILQPKRIEYIYPLKGDEERGRSIKAANSWSGSPPWTCSNCAPN